MEYLFKKWDTVKERVKNKSLFIFLDFDGTLVPIASAPDKVRLSGQVRQLLKRLADNPKLKVAVISGRAVEDVRNKIGLKNIIYSGNHGLEIVGPKINFKSVVSSRYKVVLGRIKKELEQKLACVDGVIIEDKGLTLSLHYRLVDKKDIPLVKTIFHETVIVHLVRGRIKIKPGKMVLEIRPAVDWNKGKVVLWLLGRQIFALGKEDVLPIYIGDDATDEDAFKALKNRGVTIFVGEDTDSRAKYYLKDHNEVIELLDRISKV